MRIQRNIDSKRRGSIAVETAILLPLFIIGILTIGYLLKFCMVSEGVHHALTDEAHKMMAEASFIPFPYPITSKSELENRIEAGSRGEAGNVKASIAYPSFSISKGGRFYSDMIAVSVSFDVPLKLPSIFYGDIKGERTVLCRAFTGKSQDGAVKSFSEMEQDDGGKTVWIFPRAGERYHDQHCSYIENNPREVLLDKRIPLMYEPCQLCKPGDRKEGTLVYVFETSGRVYHTGECYIVDRYVIKIGQEDAEKQGYTPCAKCGGGGSSTW